MFPSFVQLSFLLMWFKPNDNRFGAAAVPRSHSITNVDIGDICAYLGERVFKRRHFTFKLFIFFFERRRSALLKSKDSFNSSYCLLIVRFSSNSSTVFLRILFGTIQTLLSFSSLNPSRVCFADLVEGTAGELPLLNLSSRFLRPTECKNVRSGTQSPWVFGLSRLYDEVRPELPRDTSRPLRVLLATINILIYARNK